jgi:hypothetical protein
MGYIVTRLPRLPRIRSPTLRFDDDDDDDGDDGDGGGDDDDDDVMMGRFCDEMSGVAHFGVGGMQLVS